MEKLYVGVQTELKDGRSFHYLHCAKEMSLSEVRAVLTGGLTLTIKGIENPEEQYKTFKQVVRFMESELFNDDSFKDLYVGTK